jgi:hypothetical protein
MIKKWNQFIREFVEDSNNIDSIINDRMDKLEMIISNIKESDPNKILIYKYDNQNDSRVIVNFTYDDLSIKYDFDIDGKNDVPGRPLYLIKYAGDVIDFEYPVKTIVEGLDIIEKEIQMILNISEKVKAEKYKGRKIPGKYLTHKKKAMKKEIDTFRGKKEYKKDWEADIDKRSGSRIKTKKSASTKAYQRMFGNK